MTVELVIDVEIVDLTEAEATEITGRTPAWVKAFPVEDVKRAYLDRIWLPGRDFHLPSSANHSGMSPVSSSIGECVGIR